MSERFIQTDLDLLEIPGLSSRLRELYGRLRLHAGKNGRCFPTWETLAREIGVRHRITIYRLLRRLKALKLIDWRRHGNRANQYQVLVPDVAFLQRLDVAKRQPSDVAKRQPIKEAAAKEAGKREHPAPKPSPKAEAPEPRSKPSPQPVAKPNAKTGPISFAAAANADLTPEEQFRARCAERHGSRFDVDRCVANVRRQLEKRGGVTFADFVAFDAEQTTNGKKTNPNGYYVHLAKQLVEQTVRDTLDALNNAVPVTPAPPEPPRNAKGRCEECNGSGVLPDRQFCRCKLGRDLEKQARHQPMSETKPPRKGAA